MDQQETSATRPVPWRLLGIWVGVLACALAFGSWIQGERAARRQREGELLAGRAAELVSRAREAGDPETGAGLLEEARRLLETAGAAGTSRASLLVDLASLLLRSQPRADLSRVRTLLEDAWRTPDLAPGLRARIARDRGAVELLGGSADAAQEWYERAAALAPGEGGDPEEPLQTLRRSAAEGRASGR